MSKRDFTADMIFKLLESQGKIQQQLADALGVTKSQVSEWSRGITKSYNKYIGEIADFLGVSTDFLLGNEPKDRPSSFEDSLSPDEIRLIENLRKMTPSQREWFMKAAALKLDQKD